MAKFYESAISQSQKPHIKIFHKIENVGDVSIEKYDILLGKSHEEYFALREVYCTITVL